MKKVLLIDGDQFLFVACKAVEQEIRWDDQNHVLWGNAVEARRNFDGMLQRIFDRFKTTEHVLCFSTDADKPNFRLGIDSSYKGHRDDRKPMCYKALRVDVESAYRCLAMDHLEADDVMGILATKPQRYSPVIVSRDKDMKTIPTSIWDGKDLVVQSEAEADRFHLYQTLVGDTADGYPGCPGIGPVKAEKLLTHVLENHESPSTSALWHCAVVPAYVKAGLTEADALVQARLARILRFSDWDSENKKPILWSPQ